MDNHILYQIMFRIVSCNLLSVYQIIRKYLFEDRFLEKIEESENIM